MPEYTMDACWNCGGFGKYTRTEYSRRQREYWQTCETCEGEGVLVAYSDGGQTTLTEHQYMYATA